MKINNVYLLSLVLLFFMSCKKQKDLDSIYFGGEIINPKSDFVLLMKNDTVIDSLFLSKDYSFGKRFKALASGLYYFKHGYEFQYIYLEPKDSISIRLNTWDFDETLVFDGNGADKNELLIQLFLENERETTNFYSYFSLDESAFNEKIKDLLTKHKLLLEKLQESNHKLSDDYIHFIKSVIHYPIYRLKELYPYYHNKRLDKESIIMPSDDFYAYRKELNLNDDKLIGYFGYQNYLRSYLYNIAYQKNNLNLLNTKFRNILLREINAKISNETLKNKLLYQEIDYMLFNESLEIDDENLNLFFTNCTDSIAKSSIKQLLIDKKKLPNDELFPNFTLVSRQGDSLSIKSLISHKKSVVYFWSSNYSSNEYIGKRINYLTRKYPEITFIGINISNESIQNNYFIRRLSNQYYLPKNSEGMELISSKYPRAILINTDGIVINNFTLMTNLRIEKQLQNLVSK